MALGTQSLSSQGVSYGFDVWVKGQWSQTHDDTTTSNLGLACVDYKFNSSLLIGLFGQFDWSDEKDKVNSLTVGGKGWLSGPYMATRLYKNQSFDGRLAWGKSEKNINPFASTPTSSISLVG